MSEPQPAITNATLSNGLTVMVGNRPGARTLGILVMANVGGRDEKFGKTGISHFVEHLLFRGTKEHSSETELRVELGRLGARINGTTSFDHTNLFLTTRPQHLSRALSLVASMISEPTLNGIEVERRVVLDELSMHDYGDNTSEHEMLLPIWRNKGLCHAPVIGTEPTVRSLTLADVQGHLKKYWVASNMVLAISGAITLDEVLAAARPFEALTTGTPNVRTIPPPPTPGRVHASLNEYSDDCNVKLVFPCFPPDVAAFEVLDELIGGGGTTGALFRELRSKRGLNYRCSSGFVDERDFGLQVINFVPKGKDLAVATKAVVDIIKTLKTRGPTEAELLMAQESMMRDIDERLDHPIAFAHLLAFERLRGTTDIDLYARMRKVTAEAVHAHATRLFESGAGHAFYSGHARYESEVTGALAAL